MPTGMSAMALLGLGAAGSTLLSSIMKPDAPAAAAATPVPTVTPPTPMPDEKAVRAAAERTSLLDQQRRRGRASTILTDNSNIASDPLGA